jgi:putative (di)nucleoside polyphosphate hydrolase
MSFRPNVAAIVRRADGCILVCERLDIRGAWQFPQGGLKQDEDRELGLARELEEELSLRPEHYRVVSSHGPYRYEFPPGRRKEGHIGQEQYYFLVDLTGPESAINVATSDPEFRSTRWIQPGEFNPEWAMPAKRGIYAQVLRHFFGVDVSAAAE